MKTLHFTLRLNTPAFAGGAQQGTKRIDFKKKIKGVWEDMHPDVPYYPVDPSGIRVPSLRGLLAFWYRSTLGSLPAPEVFRKQSDLFGSTDRGQGLRIRPCGAELRPGVLRYEGNQANPFEHLYLGYGPLQFLNVADSSRPTGVKSIVTSYNSNACRDAILVTGSRPEIRFAAQGAGEQIEALQRALSLLHAFGGIGARSRRGWGAVELEADGITPIPSAAQLPAHLAQVVGNALGGPSPASRPRFSAFSRETRLFLTAPMASADAVLVEFAKRLLAERSYYKHAPRAEADHALETSDLALPADKSITAIPSRLSFGMPFHPKHDKVWEMEYRGRIPGDDNSKDVTRRASPLLLKVLRAADSRYVGAALFLKADFFGDPSREISEKNKLLTVPFGPAEYQVVEDFLVGTGWTNVPL